MHSEVGGQYSKNTKNLKRSGVHDPHPSSYGSATDTAPE